MQNYLTILHSAREMIESREYYYLCNAVIKSGENLELLAEAYNIERWINIALDDNTFNMYCEMHFGTDVFPKHRLMWIDWLIENVEIFDYNNVCVDHKYDAWHRLFNGANIR